MPSRRNRHEHTALLRNHKPSDHRLALNDRDIRRALQEMLLDIDPLPINYACMYDPDWLLGPDELGCQKCAKRRKLSLNTATRDLQTVLESLERNYTITELVRTYKPMETIKEVKSLAISACHVQSSALSLKAEVL